MNNLTAIHMLFVAPFWYTKKTGMISHQFIEGNKNESKCNSTKVSLVRTRISHSINLKLQGAHLADKTRWSILPAKASSQSCRPLSPTTVACLHPHRSEEGDDRRPQLSLASTPIGPRKGTTIVTVYSYPIDPLLLQSLACD